MKTIFKFPKACLPDKQILDSFATISQNDLTGEHSCIMLRMLNEEDEEHEEKEEADSESQKESWLDGYWNGKSWMEHQLQEISIFMKCFNSSTRVHFVYSNPK